MNRPITSNESDSVMRKLQTDMSSGPGGFIGDFYQTCREELTPIFLKISPQIPDEGTLLNSILQGHHHPNTKTDTYKYRSISLMNIDAKVLNKIPAD